MKKIIILVLVLVQMSVLGQKKKSLPPPQIKKITFEVPKIKASSKSIYEKILDDSEHPPLAFEWVINADSLMLANQIYSKHLEIGSQTGARLNNNLVKDSVTLKKNEVYIPLSHYVIYKFFKVDFNKDILILTERETKVQMRFKLFLNENKTEIIKIEDLKTKEIYFPTEFEGATIGM